MPGGEETLDLQHEGYIAAADIAEDIAGIGTGVGAEVEVVDVGTDDVVANWNSCRGDLDYSAELQHIVGVAVVVNDGDGDGTW